MQKKIIKLTNRENKTILIGVESIIEVTTIQNQKGEILSKICSRGAMVETNWVIETIEEIYNLINN